MIPATQPHNAVYRRETTGTDGKTRTSWEPRQIIAWGDEGQPLVIDGGWLVPAASLPDFEMVEQAQPIVGVVPGGGYRLVWNAGTAEQTVEPVLCWVTYADGEIRPIVIDQTGWNEVVDMMDEKVQVYKPGDEVPEAPAPTDVS